MPFILGAKFRKRRLTDAAKDATNDMNIDDLLNPTPDNVEWSISPEELLGTVPDAGETIQHGTLWKLNSDYEWQERLVFLSTRQLCLAKKGEACLKDSVPLHEITRVAIRRDLLGEDPANVDPEINASVLKTDKSQWHRIRGTGNEEHTLEVQTIENGYNSGRPYYFKAESEESAKEWTEQIKQAVKAEKSRREAENADLVEIYRSRAKTFYYSSVIQTIVAVLIFLNFICNVAQSEIQAEEGSDTERFFEITDLVFTSLFTVELIVNLFANWFWPFWNDGWSVFDFVVVLVSLVALGVENVPGVSTLRLMRAFRVLRLFGRLSSLRQIINALTAALLPVLNAFLIMGLVTAIYAILGVSFYKDVSPHLFGSFFRALFTMFQVCTGDGWADQVARPLFEDETGHIHPGVAVFFVSFHVIVSWTLLQVVVAVMLDNFTAAAENEKDRMRKEKAEKQGKTVAMNVLDPLLAALAHFNTTADLTARIQTLFQVLDADGSDALSFAEIREGLRKLRVRPVIQLSQEDFDDITDNGALCNAEGELGLPEFDKVIRSELKQYVQRQMANSMAMAAQDGSYAGTVLFVLKLLTIDMDDLCDLYPASVAPAPASAEGAAPPPPSEPRESGILKKPRASGGWGGGVEGETVCSRCGGGKAAGVEESLGAMERSIAELREGFERQQGVLDLIIQRLDPARRQQPRGATLMGVIGGLGGMLNPHRASAERDPATRDPGGGGVKPTPREPEPDGAGSVSASLRKKLSQRSLQDRDGSGGEGGGGTARRLSGGNGEARKRKGKGKGKERGVLFSPFSAEGQRSSGSDSGDDSMIV